MSIAFGALLLLIFLFPGFLFRIGFFNGPYSKRNIHSSFIDELIISILPALVFQIVGYSILEHVLNYDVDIHLLYQVIAGPSAGFKEDLDYQKLEYSLIGFLYYTSSIAAISFLIGYISRILVLKYHLDMMTHWLKVNNDWYYLLSAKKINFERRKKNQTEVDIIQVDLLMETQDSPYIYSGIVQDFFLSSSNGLDTIYLIDVYRRKLPSDKADPQASETDPESRYYQMPGNIFVAPYTEIKNLNITYIALTEAKEEIPQAPLLVK